MPLIDRIACRAWYNALKNESGSSSAYGVAIYCNPEVDSKRFYKYARGSVTPSHNTLKLADDKLVASGKSAVRMVFDEGPEGVPLWDALSGDFQKLWKIIDNAAPQLADLRMLRTSHEQRVNAFMNSLLPEIQESVNRTLERPDKALISELDKLTHEFLDKEHDHLNRLSGLESLRKELIMSDIEKLTDPLEVKRLKQEEELRQSRFEEELTRRRTFITGMLLPDVTIRSNWRYHINLRLNSSDGCNLSFDQLAASIALWRMSMLVADSVNRMDDLMAVLIDKIIPVMLKPYGVEKDVIEILKDYKATYRRWLYP